MPDGAYVALNGMRTRLVQLDNLASDLANVGTAGYKRENTSTFGAERTTFDSMMQKATDPTTGARKIDMKAGEVNATGRELDFAVEGPGFFVLDTPSGPRYTRNGNFERRADGTLTTMDGVPIRGQDGKPGQPKPIVLGPGAITVDPDGTVRAGATVAGKLLIEEPAAGAAITREGAGRFRVDTVTPVGNPSVRNGSLEHSNVSVVEGLSHLTSLTRSFEALQRGLTSIMNEVDGKAITELGRR